jgi:hypothetical protein
MGAGPAGTLTQQSGEEFDRVVASQARSHFVFAKSILPILKQSRSSSFTFVTGGAGGGACRPSVAEDGMVLPVLLLVSEAVQPTPLAGAGSHACMWHLWESLLVGLGDQWSGTSSGTSSNKSSCMSI